MKNKIALILLPTFLFTLVSCNGNSSSNGFSNQSSTSDGSSLASSSSKSDDDSSTDEEDGVFDGIVRIYFHDDGGTEASKAIYCWITGVNGTEYSWDGKEDGYGYYKDMDLSSSVFQGKVTDDFYFIIKFPGTWDGQSSDIKITLSDFLQNGEVDILEDGRKRINVYATDEGGGNYFTYYHKTDALGYRFYSAYIEKDWKTLAVTCTGKCVSYSLYVLDSNFANQKVAVTEAKLDNYLVYEDSPNKSEFSIDLTTLAYVKSGKSFEVKPTLTYELVGHFEDAPEKTKTKSASFEKLYDTEKFISDYTYDGDDLGVTYSQERSSFAVWSPISTKVDLLFYDMGTPKSQDLSGGDYRNDFVSKTESMRYDGHGVYRVTVKGDCSGYFYAYRLYYNGWYIDSPDPYATACGINGLRSAIVDFSKTNPSGWENVKYSKLSSPNELTPYEIHIRDLTSHATWKSRKGNERGTYNAFAESGTGYNGVKTGFDHIKELGVNAIQILPIFDQDNDERTLTDKDGNLLKPSYNWGYNPLNYNCLEGSYSSDPYSSTSRIKEFKNLVKNYADSDIRIIMDVVYNHVSSVSSHPFSYTCPRYYFRYNDDGTLIDDTGCANTVNSSRVMVSRYIVNSVKWWASEYKIKGFRFDLMGVLETDTMREVKDALYDIDPEIVVYGEGWTGGGSHASSPSTTYNIYAKLTDNGKGAIGSFNDCYRDGMKGNTLYSDVVPSGGFMNASSPSDDEIWNSSTGAIGENRWQKSAGVATPASMTVNYLSCHDNYTLYDQLNYLLNGVSNCDKENVNAKNAALASQANALMSQGIGFIHGGEEIFRSKRIYSDDEYFETLVESYQKKSNSSSSWIEGDGIKINDDCWLVRNSYKYGDSVNGFDWSRKVDNLNYFEKFKEIIELRNESYGSFLGRSQTDIDAGASICLGGSAIGAGFYSKEGSKTRLVLTSGRNKGSVNSIPLDLQGEYKVVYCSSGRLDINSNYTVYESTGIDNTFETLVLEK